MGNQKCKYDLWQDFLTANRVVDESVSLFATDSQRVVTIPYGRDRRLVLKRSDEMEQLLRRFGRELVAEYHRGQINHDGILYLMFQLEDRVVKPLYFGKAEIYGKGQASLSVNISDLVNGDGKFGRWGYNYAYHVGDLSAVTLPGHPPTASTRKYNSWRRSLFNETPDGPHLKGDIRFWACLWEPERQSIWTEYGSTRLAFEEYLLIGIASDLFPDRLLNREGRNKLEVN